MLKLAYSSWSIFINSQNDNPDLIEKEAIVSPQWAGKRLDAAASQLFSRYSRNRLQTWISQGYLKVDGCTRRGKDKLLGGEKLSLHVPDAQFNEVNAPENGSLDSFSAEPIALDIVHEDEQILVINKPAGLVMHPAPGNRTGTVLNGLLHLYPELVNVPRAGIVHRLDKDTSGLCVIARTICAQTQLVRQLQEHSVGRSYSAIALGDVPINGTVDAPIGRHPRDRKRMAVVENGKPAVTHFRCVRRYTGCAQLSIKLETGRTHQIRVHMAHLGHSLLCDPVYGRRLAVLPRALVAIDEVVTFERQALHATRLTLTHPLTNETVSFDARMPDDMQNLCDALDRLPQND